MTTTISQRARDLIVHFETDGGRDIDQPWRWPGGKSGITVGVGDDLGYKSAKDFAADWQPHLPAEWFAKLQTALGKKAEAAKAIAANFRGMKIELAWALAVFDQRTIPREIATTRAAFPGFDTLPQDAAGAIVSLVFNRGTDMDGDTRAEMRAVRAQIAKYAAAQSTSEKSAALADIAEEIRAMKRIWKGKGLDGLLARRDAEADLVQSCV